MEDTPRAPSSEKPIPNDADDAVTIRSETEEDTTSDLASRPLSRSPTVFSTTTTLRDESSREAQEVLPSDVILAFGPSDYYFLYRHQPSGESSARGPKTGHIALDIFNRIGRTYAFAFSPHGDEFAAYRDEATKAITWSFIPSQKLDYPSYQSLRSWLEINVPIRNATAMLDLKVVFGSGASYFASTFAKCTHHDLPPRLANEIDDRMSRGKGPPNILALGADATYVAAWGFRCIWHLDRESVLRRSLHDDSPPANEFANIYLSPTNKKHYMAVMKDGWITFAAPDTKGNIAGHVGAHMQAMAKQSGRTYNVKFTGSMDKMTCITPQTNFTHVDPFLKKNRKEKKRNDKSEKQEEKIADNDDGDEEKLKPEAAGVLTTTEHAKNGGLLSRVFRRKSVALQ